MPNTIYLSDQTTNFSNISLNGDNSAQLAASRVSSSGSILANAGWFSSLSLGGANLPLQISTTSFIVQIQLVQGSASSFTIATLATVKKGDILIPCLQGGAGVSSLSSGLVYTSHCTQDGQFEFRYSNVSTLVQNQSAQTFNLAIIRAF